MAGNLQSCATLVKRSPATVTVNVTVELLNRLAEVCLTDDRVAPIHCLGPMSGDLHGDPRLLGGLDDPTNPPEYEKEIRDDAVPGSRYVKLSGAGHFSPTEIPDQVNAMVEEFVAAL